MRPRTECTYATRMADITRHAAHGRTPDTFYRELASMATEEFVCLTAQGYAIDPLIRLALALQISICLCTFVLTFKVVIKARRNQLSVHSNLKVKYADSG